LGVLGRIFVAKRNSQEGIKLLERSLKENPNDISSLTALGKTYAFQLFSPMLA
jgi:cytochrome c-type biogenesis protein CcmH/NrfG